MYIYSKFIIKNIIPVLCMLTLVLTGLIWIVQILNLVNLLDKGIALKDFLVITILLLPYLLFIILPIVSVFAVIYVYSRLQSERQILVLRSAGLNNYGISKPTLIVALTTTLIAYFISIYLLPISYSSLKSNLNNFKNSYISNIIEAKTFAQVSKSINIYIDQKHSGNFFEGVVLFDNKIPESRTVYFAKKGKIVNFGSHKTGFELSQGIRHSYDARGNLTKLYFDNMVVEVTGNKTVNADIRNRTNLELFIHEMIYPDPKLPIEKQKRLIADGHLRIIWPLYNFAFVFLSLSIFLSFSYNRREYIRQYIYTFIPIISVLYFHFTLQKIAYKDLNYIFPCYANVFICIIFSIRQSMRNKL